MFDIVRFRRKLVLNNLTTAFGDKYSDQQKAKIGRSSIDNFVQTILESLISVRRPIDANIEVFGREHLNAALEKGKGVYILCAHIGNWEAMGAKITRSFCPSYVIVKKVGSKGLNRFVESLRLKNGFYWIARNKKGDGMRGIKEVLSRGEIVGFAFDQARPGEPRLPFFNQPAKTNTSLAAIWNKIEAPIVPVCIYRKGFGQHELHIQPELKMEPIEGKEDILNVSTRFNQIVESMVGPHPEQYFWLHNRWKV